ncbi:MAG: class I SAM-dependent methyltransferase [Acidimicrobiia bacterium]
MDNLDLLVDLYVDTPRQGPGSDDATRCALALAGLGGARGLAVADLGCGTGASTLLLARELDATITAVDLLPAFLARLDGAAVAAGLADRIATRCASMDEPGFEDASLDVIWSEGAVYNIGFEHGVRTWRRLLKPGGILAVSELTWLTASRPAELTGFWESQYPEVAAASAKIAVLEAAGYSPIGYFPLPEACWLDGYYRPLAQRLDAFLVRHDHAPAAVAIVEETRREIDLYERFSAYFGYGFYLARRTDEHELERESVDDVWPS